ncbi:WD40 repeat domain-containing protein [Phanerochaete sordida]|uniref:WD40 repeat domain-containing protein n=1 Tax=Phanerochaete sordida TaxID=48140 RepID=A0A9P3GPR1_9APHY|nr:WD40 repeat domain-containing protein [Phanerochaete sordida]
MFSRPYPKPLTPDKVYAGNLIALGLGYPLWCPEPHISGVPHIADVGAILHGRFIRLLHLDTSDSAADKKVTYFKPPFDNIEALHSNALLVDQIDGWLRPGHYCSHGVIHADLHASATSPIGVTGASLNLKADYKCRAAQGAALTLQSKAHAEETLSNKFLKAYAVRHFLKWHAYASEVLGFEVKPEDIILVTGWTKTTQDWAATAFGHDEQASISLGFGAGVGSLAAVDAGGSVERTAKTSALQRQGRTYSPDAQHVGAASTGSDQCVFVKGIRVKKRAILPPEILAGAGPHQLPPAGGRGGVSGAGAMKGDDEDPVNYDCEECTSGGRISDPVSIVLEYILEVSRARIAVASDDQVEYILCGRHILDLATLLRQIQLKIDVDADGVGSLCMEDVVRYQQEQKFPRPATGLSGVSELPQTAREYRRAHPPITAADLDDWPQITRKDAGSLTESQILLGPTQSKACPVQYKAMVFGDSKTMPINNEHCVFLSADGKLLASATGNTIAIWRLQDGLTVQRLERDGHTYSIRQIAFSPDGQRIVSGANDNLALVWDVKTGDVVHRLEGHKENIRCVAFSLDGTQIATRSDDSLRIWSTSTGELQYTNTDLEHLGRSTEIRFSPDGSRLAVHSDASEEDTSVVVLDCRTGERIATLHQKNIYCMALSPEGDRIATGSTDGSACVWDAASGKTLLELEEHTDDVNQVAFSPDGSEVATASDDGTVVTCDSRTGERRFTFRVESVRGNDKAGVNAVAYSPVNEFIACGAHDGCVRVWDRRTGAVVATFQRHTDTVTRLMFTPDGWDVLSYGLDKVIRMWSVRDALRLS